MMLVCTNRKHTWDQLPHVLVQSHGKCSFEHELTRIRTLFPTFIFFRDEEQWVGSHLLAVLQQILQQLLLRRTMTCA